MRPTAAVVSSESTERLDRREKRLSYQTIETLEEYLIVAQDRVEITVFRRANKWKPEVFSRLGDTVKLKSIGLSLKLSSVYEGVAGIRRARKTRSAGSAVNAT